MASEAIYMSFEGVNGEATVPGNISSQPAGGGWIELKSCAISGEPFNRRHAAVDVAIKPIEVVKLTDAATVGLLRETFQGRPDKNVVVVFVRSDVEGPTEYLRLELRKCGIAEFDFTSVEDRPAERFVIYCGEMDIISWSFEGSTRGARRAVNIVNEV